MYPTTWPSFARVKAIPCFPRLGVLPPLLDDAAARHASSAPVARLTATLSIGSGPLHKAVREEAPSRVSMERRSGVPL